MKEGLIFASVLFLSQFLFFGCQSSKIEKRYSLNPVYITNSKKISLLPTSDFDSEKKVEQILSGKYGETDFSLLCYLELDSEKISLNLFNEFGIGMGNIFYDGEKARFDSAFFPKNLKAEYIIFDLEMCYYSSDALENAFNKIGMKFVSEKDEESGLKTRKVFDGKKLIEQIEISGNKIKIQNFLRNYSYNLEEL